MTVGAVALLGFAFERALALGVVSAPLATAIPLVSQGMLLGYVLFPIGSLLILGRNPLRYLALGDWQPVVPLLAWFAVGVVVIGVGASLLPPFQAHYGRASLSPGSIAATVAALACGEFFFRGFLVLTLFPYLGWVAVAVALVPYVLLHVGKPALELLGSIPFGIALSFLAIRTGTVLYGIVLHVLMALLVPVLV